MPRKVSEIAQGNAFSLSSDGGGSAYRATRKWKVLLNAPNENWDIFQTIHVNIGDLYSATNPIPCVSVEASHEGEDRMLCIVTAEYRSSPGSDPAAPDPKSQDPTARPALYSMTTSLSEIAAWSGKVVTNGSSVAISPATNPAGDLVDGITRLEPVVTINIDQYSPADESQILGYCGFVNQSPFTFSNLTIGTHCCMLQSVTSTPVVEQFGTTTFRGFKITFIFAVRAHWALTRNGYEPIGWDIAVPQTGFNIINSGLNDPTVDQKALVLQHELGRVKMDGDKPAALASNATGKVRAMVTVSATGSDDGGFTQIPCAQPIALNDNGTPRNVESGGILINRLCLQPEMNFGTNFSAFGIRWFSLPAGL
jgi:hypothetical protein